MASDGLNVSMPDFDLEATVEKAVALLERTLTPGLQDAQKAVAKARKNKPLAKPEALVNEVTRRNRTNAARAVSYSLPSIIPGFGTAISAAGIPLALREALKEAVAATVRIGLLYERDLSDPELARVTVLLVLTRTAVALDVTNQIKPADILGRHASLLDSPNPFDDLQATSSSEREGIAQCQRAILQAWALAVAPPLLGGLLPFGIGPMAAANYVQYVMRRTIKDAGLMFAAGELAVPDVPGDDIESDVAP